MKDENSVKPSTLKQQESAFNVDSDQWWSEGKVKSRIPEKKNLFLTKFGIIVILMVIIVLIALLGSAANNKEVERDPFQMELPSEGEQQELTLLQQQIKDLRQQLDDADPTIKDSPFPNVDLGITIDQPQRR
jgi:uncharacterized membrane protein YvbJ